MNVTGSGTLGEDGKPQITISLALDSHKFADLLGDSLFEYEPFKSRLESLAKNPSIKVLLPTSEKAIFEEEIRKLRWELSMSHRRMGGMSTEFQRLSAKYTSSCQEVIYLRNEISRLNSFLHPVNRKNPVPNGPNV